MVYSGPMTETTSPNPLNPPRDYPPPPFLKALGSADSVRTPLGHYRTESLFLEVWRPIEGQRPAYVLGREDREDPKVPGRMIPSFQAAYINTMDPTGYKAAMALLGSWKHWQKLMATKWFPIEVAEWNEEIVASLRSKGLATYQAAADKGDLKAADWLSSYTHEGPAPKKTRGRPSTAEINKNAKTEAERRADQAADAARLGLTQS